MYSKVNRPKKNALNIPENAGSSQKIVNYLSKEVGENKSFFSQTSDNVSSSDVIDRIDNNKRTLKNKQDKFYMLSYNPSSSEVKHLIKQLTGKDVSDLSELTKNERKLLFDEFRSYVRDCMNVYAKSFDREKILSADDLVYFGRIEEFRHYTHDDEEVKNGNKKVGDRKEGIHLHCHVVVSRMDVTQKIALSPLNKIRSGSSTLNGKKIRNGFNMQEWQVNCFEHFGNKYRYIYSSNDTFYNRIKSYAHISKRIRMNLTKELLQGMEEEQKAIRNISKISYILHPSKRMVQNYLKNQIKNILSDKEASI